jgi:cell division protein FtsI/penicillin-binding protein 2
MNRDIVGIPRCKNFPEECDFNIDEQTARQIASNMELKEGIREWDAAFIWDSKLQRYVWKILSTLNESGDEENYKATGQEMVIDPNTGEVLALNDWRVN